jgi:Putative peptidoglycan binding domain
MKTKFYTLLVSATLISHAHAGSHHGGAGNVTGAGPGPAARGGAAPSVHSMSMPELISNRIIYSGQRFSSPASHAPGAVGFRPRYISSSGQPPVDARRPISRNVNPSQATISRFSNPRNTARELRRTNNLPSNWRNHVVAQHPGDWRRDWDRHSDHWWHGHRCHFFNGSWVIFDFGFYPWSPYWYPYDYYGYPYPYPYAYDAGYYGASAYQDAPYEDGNVYADQSISIVSAVQLQLAQQGYYRGQIDGLVGPEMRRALVRYQRSHGLRVTGGLTSDTIRSLGLRQVASY